MGGGSLVVSTSVPDDKINILLVDDQPAKLLSYEVILGELGEHLIKAASAREALEHLLRTDVAVLLVDVCMPELDGFELAAMIREHPRFEKTAIIFVSAIQITDFDRMRGYAAGAVDYVPVPVVPEVLRAKVKVFAELYRKTRQLEQLNAELERRVAERTAALEASSYQLYELNEELERRIAERTRELTEANSKLEAEAEEREQVEEVLRQSQKMEAVGQLTGGLAHDFNNLLQGITGSLELLRIRAAQGRTAEFGRYIGTAMGSAHRAATLTQRLLAFSRRQTLDPKPTDMNQLVSGMEDLFRRTVGPSIQLETSLVGEPWPILCDPNQLENALLNLVNNARDAMPDGGHLLIETTNTVLRDRRGIPKDWPPQDVPPGDYVALSVADSGTGMAPDVIARAFDPFFTTKPIGQGTGLGLSMIYGFVQQSGGHVRLRSEMGQGTTVAIYLPRYLGASIGVVEGDTIASLPAAKASSVVLVVEDEPDVRLVVCDVLSDLGYTVLEAENGRVGLSIVASKVQIDLLLTDVGLPGDINGRQLADAARQRRPGLKVLFITGYAESMMVSNGRLELGMEVMIKPFALNTLATKVQAMIDGGQQASELPVGVTPEHRR